MAAKTKKSDTAISQDDLATLLAPLIIAQKEANSLAENDVHISIDVKVTRGKADGTELLAVVQNTVTLPGMLENATIQTVTMAMEKQLELSLVTPIVGRVQNYISKKALEEMEPPQPGELGDAAFDSGEMDDVQGLLESEDGA